MTQTPGFEGALALIVCSHKERGARCVFFQGLFTAAALFVSHSLPFLLPSFLPLIVLLFVFPSLSSSSLVSDARAVWSVDTQTGRRSV